MAKRCANGEGNIRKRSDGRWEGCYTASYEPTTGKRIIKNVPGKTQAEVKTKLAKVLEEIKDLDVVRAEEYTVTTWLRTWYVLYAKPNIRLATADRYQLMIETYTIVKLHEKILKDANLEHIPLHSLRHTFATVALQNGIDVKTVSSILGHYNAGFTLRIYTHATHQGQEREAETMGNFMAQII